MGDRYGRSIDYLRISVTDRCNLRCFYCMPPQGIEAKPREEILRWEEMLYIAQVAVELGFNKFRLTGGEPLLRKGIISFIHSLSELPGVKDISITTNGLLLNRLAEPLKEAGVKRLNISLDTLNASKYREITRGGDFQTVWAGITKVLELGFSPIKINVVALRDINDTEWVNFANLTRDLPLHVRFIEVMPVGSSWRLAKKHYISCDHVRTEIEKKLDKLTPVLDTRGSGPAEYFQLPGARGTVGFIHAMSRHFCASCNRIRLTSNGKLRPCLFDQREIDLREAVRSGAGRDELKQLFRRAVQLKPDNYYEAMCTPAVGQVMAQIGG